MHENKKFTPKLFIEVQKYERLSENLLLLFSLPVSSICQSILHNRSQNIHNEKGFADSNGLSMFGPLFTELECSKGAEDLTKT